MKFLFKIRGQDGMSNRAAMLWIGSGTIVLLAVFILRGFAPAHDLTMAGGYFAGNIPGIGNTYFRLMIDGTNITGSADSCGGLISCRLEGERKPSGQLHFLLLGYGRDYEETNSIFSGTITGSPPVLRGQWTTNGGGPIPAELDRIATLHVLRRHTGFRILKYGGTKDFEVIYPEFTSPLPFHQEINQRLREEAINAASIFTGDGLRHAIDGIRNPGYPNAYEGESLATVVYFSDRIVSLCEFCWEENGGAHGNGGNLGRNFIFSGGAAHEIGLASLFEPGSRWGECLSNLCLEDLKRQEASSVTDGTITNLAAADLNSFNISPAGIMFYFSPYEVGSYAEGMFTVEIPWDKLTPFLKTNGPASLFRK